MSATTIHFVRHSKVYNPDHLLYERLPDFHLSDLGRRMAQATAAYSGQEALPKQYDFSRLFVAARPHARDRRRDS